MSRLALLTVLLCVGYSTASLVRGVDPNLASHYSGNRGTFTCIDGSKKIDLDRVNDNYCDCHDGSDEPGTSACYYGRFYCENKGHTAQRLSASFVDDGICDCCDGSDERSGCPNTCLEQSAGVVKELEEKMANYAKALELKTEAIKLAAARRTSWDTRVHTIDHEINNQKSVVEAARELKEQFNKANEERLAALNKAREEEAAARQAQIDAENKKREEEEEERRRLQEQADAEAAGAEQQEVPEAEAEAAGRQQEQEQAGDAEHEETVEERGRRIASQWTNDPDAAAVEEDDDAGHDEMPDEDDGHYDDHINNHEHGHNYDGSSYAHLGHDGASSELVEATVNLTSAEKELAQLEKEKADMAAYSQGAWDFGPNDMYFPLAGRCILDRGTQWLYQACFFDHAAQSAPQGDGDIAPVGSPSRMHLGSWAGFSQDYTVATFSGGQPCDNAPARSLKVKLYCGATEYMHDGSEPSTCVYETWLQTPLACTDGEHSKISEELQALQQQRAALQKEIDAAAGKHDEL